MGLLRDLFLQHETAERVKMGLTPPQIITSADGEVTGNFVMVQAWNGNATFEASFGDTDLSSGTLFSGQRLNGPITSITVSAGTLIAYPVEP